MKKLLIAGAGGLGRIVYQWTREEESLKKRWDSVAFLDDNPHALNRYGLSHKIVGSIEGYEPSEGEELVCAIGDPFTQNHISKSLEEKGAAFTSIIHPGAVVTERCAIGKGVILFPGVYVFTDALIGDFVVINSLTTIAHDAVIGRGCIISVQCDVMGNVFLGEQVFLGSGARILPGIRVGNRARIGAGSVVIRNVKADTTVFGNPAKVIYRPGEEEGT